MICLQCNICIRIVLQLYSYFECWKLCNSDILPRRAFIFTGLSGGCFLPQPILGPSKSCFYHLNQQFLTSWYNLIKSMYLYFKGNAVSWRNIVQHVKTSDYLLFLKENLLMLLKDDTPTFSPNSMREGVEDLTMRRKIQKKSPCLNNNNTDLIKQISLFETALVMKKT